MLVSCARVFKYGNYELSLNICSNIFNRTHVRASLNKAWAILLIVDRIMI